MQMQSVFLSDFTRGNRLGLQVHPAQLFANNQEILLLLWTDSSSTTLLSNIVVTISDDDGESVNTHLCPVLSSEFVERPAAPLLRSRSLPEEDRKQLIHVTEKRSGMVAWHEEFGNCTIFSITFERGTDKKNVIEHLDFEVASGTENVTVSHPILSPGDRLVIGAIFHVRNQQLKNELLYESILFWWDFIHRKFESHSDFSKVLQWTHGTIIAFLEHISARAGLGDLDCLTMLTLLSKGGRFERCGAGALLSAMGQILTVCRPVDERIVTTPSLWRLWRLPLIILHGNPNQLQAALEDVFIRAGLRFLYKHVPLGAPYALAGFIPLIQQVVSARQKKEGGKGGSKASEEYNDWVSSCALLKQMQPSPDARIPALLFAVDENGLAACNEILDDLRESDGAATVPARRVRPLHSTLTKVLSNTTRVLTELHEQLRGVDEAFVVWREAAGVASSAQARDLSKFDQLLPSNPMLREAKIKSIAAEFDLAAATFEMMAVSSKEAVGAADGRVEVMVGPLRRSCEAELAIMGEKSHALLETIQNLQQRLVNPQGGVSKADMELLRDHAIEYATTARACVGSTQTLSAVPHQLHAMALEAHFILEVEQTSDVSVLATLLDATPTVNGAVAVCRALLRLDRSKTAQMWSQAQANIERLLRETKFQHLSSNVASEYEAAMQLCSLRSALAAAAPTVVAAGSSELGPGDKVLVDLLNNPTFEMPVGESILKLIAQAYARHAKRMYKNRRMGIDRMMRGGMSHEGMSATMGERNLAGDLAVLERAVSAWLNRLAERKAVGAYYGDVVGLHHRRRSISTAVTFWATKDIANLYQSFRAETGKYDEDLGMSDPPRGVPDGEDLEPTDWDHENDEFYFDEVGGDYGDGGFDGIGNFSPGLPRPGGGAGGVDGSITGIGDARRRFSQRDAVVDILKRLMTISESHILSKVMSEVSAQRRGDHVSFLLTLSHYCAEANAELNGGDPVFIVEILKRVMEKSTNALGANAAIESLVQGFQEAAGSARNNTIYLQLFQHSFSSLLSHSLKDLNALGLLEEKHSQFLSEILSFAKSPLFLQTFAVRAQFTSVERLERLFRELASLIDTGKIYIRNVKIALERKAALESGWESIPTMPVPDLSAVVSGIEWSWLHRVQPLRELMTALMPHCSDIQTVDHLYRNWTSMHIASVHQILRSQLIIQTAFAAPGTTGLDTGDSAVFDEGTSASLSPLPAALVNYCDWLADATKFNNLFKTFWIDNQCESPSDIEKIIPLWQRLYSGITDGSLTMGALATYGDILISGNEIAVFIRSIHTIDKVDTAHVEFPSEVREKEEQEFLDHLLRWKAVEALRANTVKINQTLKETTSNPWFVVVSDHSRIEALSHDFSALNAVIAQNGAWADQPSQRITDTYWEFIVRMSSLLELTLEATSTISDVEVSYRKVLNLVKIEAELLPAMPPQDSLFAWLRTINDDNVFDTSIEIARGMGVSIAPPELWDATSNRISEEYLSTLINVRTYFHKFLYSATQPCESWPSFVETFSRFPASMDYNKILRDMASCSEPRILAALQTIIGLNKGITGSSRLFVFYSPRCPAQWTCASTAGGNSGGVTEVADRMAKVTLQYFDHDTWKECSHDVLNDLQGMVALEKTSTPTQDSFGRDLRQLFLDQYSWMRRLADACRSLHQSCHYDYYPVYSVTMSTNDSVDDYRDKEKKLKAQLSAWTEHVEAIRESHYFINYFDLSRCLRLIEYLKSSLTEKSLQDLQDLQDSLRPFVSCVNPDFAHISDNLTSLSVRFREEWLRALEADSRGALLSDEALLTKLAVVLDESFQLIPTRYREVTVDGMGEHVLVLPLRDNVHVAVGNSPVGLAPKGQYDQLLTLAAIQGCLPEYETCLSCDSHTSLEQVVMLLYRWRRSSTSRQAGGVNKRLFAIVEADKLSYEVQNAALLLLRSLALAPEGVPQPFVIVTESEQCHLASQYMHNRITNGVLPLNKLSELCSSLRASCHISQFPGAGKTFAIRCKTKDDLDDNSRHPSGGQPVNAGSAAAPSKALKSYGHLLVHEQVTPRSLLVGRLNALMSELNLNRSRSDAASASASASIAPAGTILHVDISSPCGEGLIGTLFEIVVLGVATDSDSGEIFSYDPASVRVCVELAAGLHLKSFSFCQAFGTVHHCTAAGSFCADKEDLMIGMGIEEFYGVCGEGPETTASHSTASSLAARVTAFDRLLYVAKGLQELRERNGCFPTSFDISTYEQCLSADETYDSLNTACGGMELKADDTISWRPSYWCLWSFVNLVYMQMQSLQDTESPVSLACVPDQTNPIMSAEFDTTMKQRIKGELVKFILRTAREFVARQIADGGSDSAIAVGDPIKGILLENHSCIKESQGEVWEDMLQYVASPASQFASQQARNAATATTRFDQCFWKRLDYDNDGRPVFESPFLIKETVLGASTASVTKYKRYLYFRQCENRWVFDDVVKYTGELHGYSADGKDDLESATFQSCNKQREELVTLTVVTAGVPNGGVRITGFERCKSGPGITANADCNGIYLPAEPLFDTVGDRFEYAPLRGRRPAAGKEVALPIATGARVTAYCPLLRNAQVGAQVEAEARGCWYPAQIIGISEVSGNVMFEVAYLDDALNDGSSNMLLREYRVRPLKPWLPAIVAAVAPGGVSYDVTFQDATLNNGSLNKGLRDFQIRPEKPLRVLHYVKTDGPRRHLYLADFGTQALWVISTSCNLQYSGYMARSRLQNLDNMSGTWSYAPANNVEENLRIRYVQSSDLQRLFAAATPLPIDAVRTHTEDAFGLGVDNLRSWHDSNHESFFFNNRSGQVSFLSLDPEKLRQDMHPVLKQHLENNHVQIGENLKVLSDKHWEILAGLTGISRTKEEAAVMMGTQFCLTGDSLLKILAIVQRTLAKIPVVLMGECGCGKTMLISFLCRWMGVSLVSLDVHGGTTEADIVDTFERAARLLEGGGGGGGSSGGTAVTSVFVFLDEVNTCEHMGLINEVVCHRAIYGRRLHDGIQILAALNPYRLRAKQQNMGISASVGSNSAIDEMSKLVYRVKPIPPTLKEFIFDFGSLDSDTELKYIQSMIKSDAGVRAVMLQTPSRLLAERTYLLIVDKDAQGDGYTLKRDKTKKFAGRDLMLDHVVRYAESLYQRELDILGIIINRAQECVREEEGDRSVVSLRDVKRVLVLLRWFHEHLNDSDSGNSPRSPGSGSRSDTPQLSTPIAHAAVLALAHVYYYRLSTADGRVRLFNAIVAAVVPYSAEANPTALFGILVNPARLHSIIDRTQNRFMDELSFEEDVSMNQALKENVFVSIVCILNKIPIFVVGKPGTSKTLAIQIVQSNLKGLQSPKQFWYRFAPVNIFQYQCSPMSTTQSIKSIYENAVKSHEHSEGQLTVLLLDEVGLAENSPDMPLKVLHYMLVDPPISIVGISNWTLDSSKMNRAILLQRPEPSDEDLLTTAKDILAVARTGSPRLVPTPSRLQEWLGPLARAYKQIYTQQQALLGLKRDFFGMRDYYSMIKFIRSMHRQGFTEEVLAHAVGRNFGGLPRLAQQVLVSKFAELCFPDGGVPTVSAETMVRDNLEARASRNLMIVSENDNVLPLLFGSGILSESRASVLVGSRFADDMEELFLIQQINYVKVAMAEGKVAVLVNNDAIYESLYDVLNQRYVRQRNEAGEELRWLRLAVGARSELCSVHEDFKIILVVKQESAYENLDLPLLNRFEKQALSPTDLLSGDCEAAKRSLNKWCDLIYSEINPESKGKAIPVKEISKIFCGFYEGTISSLLLSLSGFGRREGQSAADLIRQAKKSLLKLATPAAALFSRSLKTLIHEQHRLSSPESVDETFGRYISTRSDFFAVLADELRDPGRDAGTSRLFAIVTRSAVEQMGVCIARMQETLSQDSDPIIHELISNEVKCVALSAISSERVLITILDSFYADASVQGSQLMVILCDPLHCSAASISHAQHLIERRFQLHIRSETTHSFVRHVAMVINLPPGLHMRERQFSLDLYEPWSYAYVDEVEPALTGPALLDIVRSPIHELCVAVGAFDASPRDLPKSVLISIKQYASKQFLPALSLSISPRLSDQADPRGQLSRVKLIKDLTCNQDFLDFLVTCIHGCLSALDKNDPPLSKLHVKLAIEDDRGSLRRSLCAAVEKVLTSGMAFVLRMLDENLNLSWLHERISSQSPSDAVSNRWVQLWIELAKKVYDLNTENPEKWMQFDAVAQRLKKGSQVQPKDRNVANTGRHGGVACRFPFSEKLLAIFADNTQVRSIVEAESPEPLKQLQKVQSRLAAFLQLEFAQSLYDAVLSVDADAYLHDFVATRIHPIENLTFDFQFQMYKSIFSVFWTGLLPPSELTKRNEPAAVHVASWVLESRLFRLVSACKLVKAAILRGRKKFSRQSGGHLEEFGFHFETSFLSMLDSLLSQQQQQQHHLTIEVLDSAILQFFLRLLSASIERIDPEEIETVRFWLDLRASLQPDLDALADLVVSHDKESQQSLWRLHATAVIMGAHTASFDSRLSRMSIRTILASLRNADPTSASSLAGFLEACRTSPPHWVNIVHVYVKEFLGREIALLQQRQGDAAMGDTNELVAMLGSILFDDVSATYAVTLGDDHRSSFQRDTLRLHKTVVNCIYLLAATRGPEIINTWLSSVCNTKPPDSALHVVQLVLERIEADDAFMTARLALLLPVSSTWNDRQFENMFRGVSALATAESVSDIIGLFARTGTELISELAVVKRFTASQVDPMVMHIRSLKLSESRNVPTTFVWATLESQIFFLTHLQHRLGKSGLVTYLRQSNLPCLPAPAIPIDPRAAVLKTFDPFSSLGGKEPYSTCCVAVVKAAYDISADKLNEWWTAPTSRGKSELVKAMIFLASIASQIVGDAAHVDGRFKNSVTTWLHGKIPAFRNVVGTARLLLSAAPGQAAGGFEPVTAAMDPVRLYLQTHIGILAMSNETSWFTLLLSDPQKLQELFIPSMADSEMAQLLLSASQDRDVGVYECPNGHMYTIGDCLNPNASATCDNCGAPIGNEKGASMHTLARGNKRLGRARELLTSLTTKGYLLDSCSMDSGYDVPRLGKLTVAVLRFLLHSIMLLSAELYPIANGRCENGGLTGAAQLMYPGINLQSMRSPSTVLRQLRENADRDWQTLVTMLQMTSEDVAMGMHMIISHLKGVANGVDCIQTAQNRMAYEQSFEKKVEYVFTAATSKELIRAERALYEKDNIDDQLKRSLQTHYPKIMELSAPPNPAARKRLQLWRYREDISFDQFFQAFERLGRRRAMFPVTSAVLGQEPRLSLIKYTADILEWQGLLLQHLKPSSLDRSEALGITNEDFVENIVPEKDRAYAREVLRKYCVAFNRTFHCFPGEPLYECAANIFSPEGNPESWIEMAPGESVAFALPNRKKKADEGFSINGRFVMQDVFVEPRNLCSIFILDKLQGLQNNIVQALTMKPISESDLDDEIADAGAAPALGGGGGGRVTVAVAGGVEGAHETETQAQAPLFTFRTPISIVRKQLLDYDRETHLMPSVFTFADQRLEFGQGQLIGFDFGRIEADLRDRLLPSAQPFALAQMDFTFKGETHHKSQESELVKQMKRKVPQANLIDSEIEQICLEIDTLPRRAALSAQIENCIVFIASSAGLMDGEMKMNTFMLDILQLDSATWQSVSGPTLERTVCLKHLKSLHQGLQRRRDGGFVLFPDLDLEDYGTLLDAFDIPKIERQARDTPILDLRVLVGVLEDFIWFKLCGQPLRSFSGAALSVQENIGYDYDGQWFDFDFPYVKISQAYELFKLLKKMC